MDIARKSVAEVCEWLESENFSDKVVTVFGDNDIDGETLLMLEEKDLNDLVNSIGARRKLMVKINELKSLQKQTNAHQSPHKRNCSPEDSVGQAHTTERDDQMPIMFSSPEGHTNSFMEYESDETEIMDPLPKRVASKRKLITDSEDSSPDYTKSIKSTPNTECDLWKSSPSQLQCSSKSLEADCSTDFQITPKRRSKFEETSSSDYVKQGHVDGSPALVQRLKPLIITKKQPEPPLPTPFELPRNYPPIVMAELENSKLSGKGKAKLVSSIAAAIYRFKSFPTSDEYNHVGQQIVLKYTFLKSNEGSGYGYLVQALRDKMKYLRSFGKPKNISSDKSTLKKKKVTDFKQFPKSSDTSDPPVPPGEDEHSFQRNKKMLLSEETRTNTNKQTVHVLMERTFAFRRRDILHSPKPIKEMLQEYPSLKRLEQIHAEMCYIFPSKTFGKEMTKKWCTLLPTIFQIAALENNSKIAPFLEVTDYEFEGAKGIVAMILTYYMLIDPRTKADVSKIITFVQEDADINYEAKHQICPQPIIIVRGTASKPRDAFLVTEGVFLCRVPLQQVPFTLLASFYVFNMQYPSSCNNFFSFLEFIFLNITPPRQRSKLQHFITSVTHSLTDDAN